MMQYGDMQRRRILTRSVARPVHADELKAVTGGDVVVVRTVEVEVKVTVSTEANTTCGDRGFDACDKI
jgi:hypothetical protein